MAERKTIKFNNPDQLTFDPSLIEIVGEQIQLLSNGVATREIDYIDVLKDGEGTFDPAKTSFDFSGILSSVDQRPIGGQFYASYSLKDNDPDITDASWIVLDDAISLTPTSDSGSPVINSNFGLDLTGGGQRFVEYFNLPNIVDVTNKGTFRVTWVPNFNGTPESGETYVFYNLSQELGSPENGFIFGVDEDGKYFLQMWDNTGTQYFDYRTQPNSFVAGVPHEVEVNFDFDLNFVNLLVDGALQFSRTFKLNSSNPRNADSGRHLRVGSGISGLIPLNGLKNDSYFSNLFISNEVSHIAAYTIGEAISETIFLGDTVFFPAKFTSGVSAYLDFANDSSLGPAAQAPRFILNILYWDGAAWVPSNGTFEQATRRQELNSQITLLPPSAEFNFKIVTTETNFSNSYTRILFELDKLMYPTVAPKCINLEPIALSTLLGPFFETVEPEGTSLQYILNIDDLLMWFDGNNWTLSDGTLPQSNAASLIRDKVSLLLTGLSQQILTEIHVFLISDGEGTPKI